MACTTRHAFRPATLAILPPGPAWVSRQQSTHSCLMLLTHAACSPPPRHRRRPATPPLPPALAPVQVRRPHRQQLCIAAFQQLLASLYFQGLNSILVLFLFLLPFGRVCPAAQIPRPLPAVHSGVHNTSSDPAHCCRGSMDAATLRAPSSSSTHASAIALSRPACLQVWCSPLTRGGTAWRQWEWSRAVPARAVLGGAARCSQTHPE